MAVIMGPKEIYGHCQVEGEDGLSSVCFVESIWKQEEYTIKCMSERMEQRMAV